MLSALTHLIATSFLVSVAFASDGRGNLHAVRDPGFDDGSIYLPPNASTMTSAASSNNPSGKIPSSDDGIRSEIGFSIVGDTSSADSRGDLRVMRDTRLRRTLSEECTILLIELEGGTFFGCKLAPNDAGGQAGVTRAIDASPEQLDSIEAMLRSGELVPGETSLDHRSSVQFDDRSIYLPPGASVRTNAGNRRLEMFTTAATRSIDASPDELDYIGGMLRGGGLVPGETTLDHGPDVQFNDQSNLPPGASVTTSAGSRRLNMFTASATRAIDASPKQPDSIGAMLRGGELLPGETALDHRPGVWFDDQSVYLPPHTSRTTSTRSHRLSMVTGATKHLAVMSGHTKLRGLSEDRRRRRRSCGSESPSVSPSKSVTEAPTAKVTDVLEPTAKAMIKAILLIAAVVTIDLLVAYLVGLVAVAVAPELITLLAVFDALEAVNFETEVAFLSEDIIDNADKLVVTTENMPAFLAEVELAKLAARSAQKASEEAKDSTTYLLSNVTEAEGKAQAWSDAEASAETPALVMSKAGEARKGKMWKRDACKTGRMGTQMRPPVLKLDIAY